MPGHQGNVTEKNPTKVFGSLEEHVSERLVATHKGSLHLYPFSAIFYRRSCQFGVKHLSKESPSI
jgi:hypothetical protein